jgi:hypothetical protein
MLEKSYIKFLDDLKIQIKQSRIKAHLAVNRELILLYYNIGLAILEKQKEEGWGTKIVERVAKDLKQEFSEIQNKNDLSIIESIIRKGANVNCTNSAGATPLHLACDNGHTETASALIGNGANFPLFPLFLLLLLLFPLFLLLLLLLSPLLFLFA